MINYTYLQNTHNLTNLPNDKRISQTGVVWEASYRFILEASDFSSFAYYDVTSSDLDPTHTEPANIVDLTDGELSTVMTAVTSGFDRFLTPSTVDPYSVYYSDVANINFNKRDSSYVPQEGENPVADIAIGMNSSTSPLFGDGSGPMATAITWQYGSAEEPDVTQEQLINRLNKPHVNDFITLTEYGPLTEPANVAAALADLEVEFVGEARHGDIWLRQGAGNNGWTDTSDGTFEFMTLMHEVGHSLGLPTARGYGDLPDLHIAMSLNEDLLDMVKAVEDIVTEADISGAVMTDLGVFGSSGVGYSCSA